MGEGLISWLKRGGMSGQEARLLKRERRQDRRQDKGEEKTNPLVYDGETVEPNVFRAGQDPIKIGGSDVKPRKEVAVPTVKDASVEVKKGVEYAPDARRKIDGESVQVGGSEVVSSLDSTKDDRFEIGRAKQPHDKGQRKERWE